MPESHKIAFGLDLKELWELFPIILTPPDERWQEWARQETSLLQKILNNPSLKIHHIGSTAIREIWAKPIVDLLLEVGDTGDFPHIKTELLAAGYLCMAETERRMSFNKGYTPKGFAQRVFHLMCVAMATPTRYFSETI